MKTLKTFIRILIISFALTATSVWPSYLSAQDQDLDEWSSYAKKNGPVLIKWLRENARAILSAEKVCCFQGLYAPRFYGKLGLFITLRKGQRVRGCYGAFSHRIPDIEKTLIEYLKGALMSDPRYRPLELSELDDTEIILTISTDPRPAEDISFINPFKKGIVIQCGNEQRVYVPAELRYQSTSRLVGPECTVSEFSAITIK